MEPEFTLDEIEKALTGKSDIEYPVDKMKSLFSQELQEFNPLAKAIEIQCYFGDRIGKVGSLNMLLDTNIIRNKKDVRGLYVFIHQGNPFYAGITRNLPFRIQQHVKGHNGVTATLAYRIARNLYTNKYKTEPEAWKGEKFKRFVNPVKEVLMNKQLAFAPIENDIEMALFEIYFATKFRTLHNHFRTH